MKPTKEQLKVGEGILKNFEINFLEKLVPFIPKSIETYHLTYMTLVWSLLIILGGYLSIKNVNWLWFVSAMIFLQYVTDFYDGKIGKTRKTGLIKWGFYMDHFLDYVFLVSIFMAYSFLIPNKGIWLIALLGVSSGFMIHTFLRFSSEGEFKIYYFFFGPTEMRIFFILINIFIIYFGVSFFIFLLPYIFFISLVFLIIIVYNGQKRIWKLDEKIKGKKI